MVIITIIIYKEENLLTINLKFFFNNKLIRILLYTGI